jgi:hypothetical protein
MMGCRLRAPVAITAIGIRLPGETTSLAVDLTPAMGLSAADDLRSPMSVAWAREGRSDPGSCPGSATSPYLARVARTIRRARAATRGSSGSRSCARS